jgi:hypothetical protein
MLLDILTSAIAADVDIESLPHGNGNLPGQRGDMMGSGLHRFTFRLPRRYSGEMKHCRRAALHVAYFR